MSFWAQSKNLRTYSYICSENGAKILRLPSVAQDDTVISAILLMKADNNNLDLSKECDCMNILGSFFLLIVGVLMLCFPDVVYSITESWKSNASSEPSGLYKLHIRIGGIACSLVGIVGLIANFVL